MSLAIKTHTEGAQAHVIVEGEVDVSCAAQLREQLTVALSSEATEVVVDVSAMSYIDSTGIGVLMGAVHHAQTSHKTLRVAHPQKNVTRVFAMLGISDELGINEAR